MSAVAGGSSGTIKKLTCLQQYELDGDTDIEDKCDCSPTNERRSVETQFKKRDCFSNKPEDDEWIRIGTVKYLLVYPVDCGDGFQENSVICTRDGPEFDSMDPAIRNIRDRRLVVYKQSGDKISFDPAVNILNLKKKNVFYYGRTSELENPNEPYIDKFSKKYDNFETTIYRRQEINDEFKNLHNLYKSNKNNIWNIGYLSPLHKRILNDKIRFTNENYSISGMYPQFSHYTLINSKSLQHLKSRYQYHKKIKHTTNSYSKQITHLNFYPHIVMEGDPCTEYQEDSAVRVKIGNVEFGNILPYVNDERSIQFNRIDKTQPFDCLYDYLRRKRPLEVKYAELKTDNSDQPAFGINMEKLDVGPNNDENNRIRVGDIIYIRYQV